MSLCSPERHPGLGSQLPNKRGRLLNEVERARASKHSSVLECESVHGTFLIFTGLSERQHFNRHDFVSGNKTNELVALCTWQLNWKVETTCASKQPEAYCAIVGSFSINSKLIFKFLVVNH